MCEPNSFNHVLTSNSTCKSESFIKTSTDASAHFFQHSNFYMKGNGFKCSKKLLTIYKFNRTSSHELSEVIMSLTVKECEYLMKTKSCDNIRLRCRSDTDCDLEPQVSFLSQILSFHFSNRSGFSLLLECSIKPVMIEAVFKNSLVSINNKSDILYPCLPDMMGCVTASSTIVWNTSIITKNQLEYVGSVRYCSIVNNNTLLIDKLGMLFNIGEE